MAHTMDNSDTIVAQATPPGRGGIAVLRVSGPHAESVALQVLGKVPPARYASYLPFLAGDGAVLDWGIALWFPAPHSFTGEDVLELHGHGGPVVINMLLKRIAALPNVRIAQPGEFSQRAFLNDKIDLAQAEAIADLIDARSEQAARSALASLQGVFSTQINQLVEALTQLRIHVEAAIDFPDEEIDPLATSNLQSQLDVILATLTQINEQAKQGACLREGLNVVIAGLPNAGKSSLLNMLSGHETAIVTPIAGTTRDILREHIHLDGIPLHIIDTAGLRDTTDEVERIGIERAWQAIAQADQILFLVDGTVTNTRHIDAIWPEFAARLPPALPVTLIRNKCDISGEAAQFIDAAPHPVLCLSAATGEGMELLRAHLKASAGLTSNEEGLILARQRHLTALASATATLQQAKLHFSATPPPIELLAEDLRIAQQILAQITGDFSADDLLGRIFADFCIGK